MKVRKKRKGNKERKSLSKEDIHFIKSHLMRSLTSLKQVPGLQEREHITRRYCNTYEI